MYQSFRVKNFRCFRDLQVNDLGRVNLIAGRNNTGKTALMEAMHVLAGTYSGQVLLRNPTLRRANLMDGSESETGNQLSWSTIFSGLKTDLAIEMSAEENRPDRTRADCQPIQLSIKSVQMSDTCDDDPRYQSFGNQYDALPDDAELLKLVPSLDRGRPTYLALAHSRIVFPRLKPGRFRPSQLLHARTGASARDIERRFNRLQWAKGIEALVQTLRLIEPNINDVRIDTGGWRAKLMIDIGLDNMIPMSHAGEGMSRLSDIILAMQEAKGGLIFIDEIENGIHHSVQCQVWQAIGKLAHELEIQVFATTHSLEMIRAAYEAFSADGTLDDFRFHRLDRHPETGDIEATTYNELDIQAVAAFNFEHEVR